MKDSKIILRPDQEEVVEKVRSSMRAGNRSVLMVCPTGFGKTATTSCLIKEAVSRGHKCVFYSHRIYINYDTMSRFANAKINATILSAGFPYLKGADVVVASIQTAYSRGEFPEADLVIIDEAHHGNGAMYGVVKDAYPKAWILGLTATPGGWDLSSVFDDLVTGPSVKWMIEHKLLSRFEYYAPSNKGQRSMPIYDAIKKYSAGRRTIVFCSSVEEANKLYKMIPGSAIITEKTPKEERTKFLAHGSPVVLNVYALTEGFDMPKLEVAILGGAMSSEIMFLQACGRVLRVSAGKEYATIVDLTGAVHVHGMPDEEREFTLTGGMKRKSVDSISTCLKCGRVFYTSSSSACPECGETVIKKPARERVDWRQIHRILEADTQEDRVLFLSTKMSIGLSKGYHWKWARNQYVFKYGHEPSRDIVAAARHRASKEIDSHDTKTEKSSGLQKRN